MKKLIYMAVCIVALAACNDDDNGQVRPNERDFTVEDYNQIRIGTGVTVINQVQGSGAGNGRMTSSGNPGLITVKGNPQLISGITIEVIDGVVYIRASNEIELEDSVKVEFNTADVSTITLEANQHATVYWEAEETILENLEIKTEANSTLEFFGLKATNVSVKQEAESQVLLTSGGVIDLDSVVLEAEWVEVVTENTALIDDHYLYTFDHIELYVDEEDNNKEYYIITGVEIWVAFIIDNVEVRTEATTSFNAVDAAVANMDIKLEGESEATVWVLDALHGTGQGSSKLYYRGDPQINFTVEGSAEIIPL